MTPPGPSGTPQCISYPPTPWRTTASRPPRVPVMGGSLGVQCPNALVPKPRPSTSDWQALAAVAPARPMNAHD